MGLQACPLPTAILSNQTGYASYFFDDYTEHMEAYMLEWKKEAFSRTASIPVSWQERRRQINF